MTPEEWSVVMLARMWSIVVFCFVVVGLLVALFLGLCIFFL